MSLLTEIQPKLLSCTCYCTARIKSKRQLNLSQIVRKGALDSLIHKLLRNTAGKNELHA